MRIDSSNIYLDSQSTRTQERELEQSASAEFISRSPSGSNSSVVLEHDAEYQYEAENTQFYYATNRVSEGDSTVTESVDSRLLTEMLNVTLSGKDAVEAVVVKNGQPLGPAIPGFTGRAEIAMSQYQFLTESETLMMSSRGSVTTEDGRTIDFSMYIKLASESSYTSTESFVLDVQQMKDPLVINFGTESVSLTDQFIEFDFEGDGKQETIASLSAGSGYLVLDRNGNGAVDDGGELFGVRTGQGFSELAVYDDDGNLWIDENDDIFSELQIWVQDEGGAGSLRSLSDIGVGAIYLGSTESQFSLHSDTGRVLGEIKASGIVLMENGEAKSIEEIDLVDLSEPTQVPDEVRQIETVLDVSNATSGEPAALPQDARVIAITNALEKLNEIREQQKAYSESLSENAKQPKSMLETLLEKMDYFRQLQEDKQRREADEQYRLVGVEH